MSNEKRGNGKTKKVIVGVATIVAVAAIAVPTALTLTGGKENAGASNEGSNKYTIIVSSGIENIPDYSISLTKGTKIGELKTLLKVMDGYSMEGIFKDESMQQPYSDEDIISSSTKIYIKFVEITYSVNIYNENRELVDTITDIAYKSNLNLSDAEKAETGYAKYIFTGWVDETGNPVDITCIMSDLNIYPTFKVVEKEYKIGFTNSNNIDSISVSVGGESITLDSTYHYGSKIKLVATAKLGNDITSFTVSVENGDAVNILTFANRVEKDGKIYYEYEIEECNGNLNIVYTEDLSEYVLTIPSGVTVKREGKTLQSGTTIKYGDELEITYTESEGHHKTDFRLEWAEHITGDLWKVTGDLNIIYAEERDEYSLGSIPEGVTVKRGEVVLTGNSKIYYGDTLTFTYTQVTEILTGNTKQENGYNYSEKETTTYILMVNGLSKVSGANISVSDNITLDLTSSSSLSWEQGSRIEYTLGTIPSGVTVISDGKTLTSGSKIYHGDKLVVNYTEIIIRNTGNTKQENGYNYTEKETITYSLKLNNTSVSSGYDVIITGDVILSLTSSSSKSWEQGSRIEYSIGAIPSGVTVKRGNTTLSNNSTIYYGDSITFTYTTTSTRYTGNTKQENGYNYSEKETTTYILKANNSMVNSGSTITVTGNLNLNLSSTSTKSWEQGSRIEYSIGAIPSGVTVKRGNTILSNNATIYYGDSITFTYTTTSTRYTGNTKQENGYNYSEKETITNMLAVNGTNRSSGYSMSVTGNVTLNLSSTSTKAWEQGSRIEYSISIPSGVTVKRNGSTISSSTKIYYGDVLTFTYTTSSAQTATGNTESRSDGYYYNEYRQTNYSLSVNGSSMSTGGTYTVSGNVTATLSSSTSTTWVKGDRIAYSLSFLSNYYVDFESGTGSLLVIYRDGKALTASDYVYFGDNITIQWVDNVEFYHAQGEESYDLIINGNKITGTHVSYETEFVPASGEWVYLHYVNTTYIVGNSFNFEYNI